MDRYSPWKAALLWDAHNLAFMGLRRAGVPVSRIEYEDLVQLPGPTVEAAARFLGLDPAGVGGFIHADTVTLASAHQVAGNPDAIPDRRRSTACRRRLA